MIQTTDCHAVLPLASTLYNQWVADLSPGIGMLSSPRLNTMVTAAVRYPSAAGTPVPNSTGWPGDSRAMRTASREPPDRGSRLVAEPQ